VAAVPRSAFVTGGSGFIGTALIRCLVAGGGSVRALARSDASAAAVAELGAEPARGDLEDVAAMTAAADGCDVAFHLAAEVAEWGPIENFRRTNVEGTRNALEATSAAAVGRFVHCGTEAAVLAGEPLVNADETAPLRPDSAAPYSATKAEAERLVRDAARDGFETVVVRPRLVWGPEDRTVLPRIAAATEAGRFAWIGGGNHLTSTTHIDNTIEGLLLAAERGGSGQAYFVTDGPPVAFREFISDLLRTRDIEPPTRSIPPALARILTDAGELAWRVLPLGGAPPLTRFGLWFASQECTLDDSKARRELGYAPVISRREGIDRLAAS
jgi:nucleoside-diphosphate-sugar epimerase